MAEFNALRVVKQYTMDLCAAPADVFPLLCPVRESDWIEPWTCDMVFTAGGVAENNAVFRTDFAAQGGSETWVVCRYEPGRAIEFIRFLPDFKINRLDIVLTATRAGTTAATWTNTYTGLSEAGNAWIRNLQDETFRSEKELVETLLNHYLKTGDMLKMTDLKPDRNPYGQDNHR